MRSRRVSHIREYLDPAAPSWPSAPAELVTMIPTPLGMQPTEYVRKSWDNRPYGAVKGLRVASVHDGHTWAMHASWSGVSPANGDFPDALAVALPVSGKPVLAMMGAPNAPIHILRWQAGKDGVRSVLATGIGQSRPGPGIRAAALAHADGDTWSVVVTRPLGAGLEVAPLAAGGRTGVGFAIWRGGNDERAGIKAFSVDWAELVLDA